MAQAMGLGVLGDRELVYKRKFRWTFSIEDICNGKKVDDSFVKVAARPSLTIEETEINRLNAKTWIPGKASWETMTVTYYDVASLMNMNLWSWLASVYDFTDPVALKMGSSRRDYGGRGILTLFDGCGGEIEKWTLEQMWPTAVNFGDLDYSASDECNIELTLRYSAVTYKQICPGGTISPCCTPCGS